jgi:hypothetical protein
MTPDDRIAAALRRLAGQLDVETGDPPKVERSRPAAARFVAVALVVAAVAGTVAIVAARQDRHRALPVSTEATVATSTPVQQAVTSSTSSTSSTSTAPTPPVDEPLSRPIIEMPGCSTSWARGPSSGGGPYHPYAHRTLDRATVQVFASPGGAINDPYVVVIRYFAGEPPTTGIATGDVGEQHGPIVNGKGGGSVQWVLSDGSEVYVRDHLFDKSQLLEIARALAPRPADATVPGVDLAEPAPFGLTLLDETFDPLEFGPGASSGCTAPPGGELIASVWRGRPVSIFTAYLDQPSPYSPVKMLADGAVVMVRSRLTDLDPEVALQSIRQASIAEWEPMLLNAARDEVTAAISLPAEPALLGAVADQHFSSFTDLQSVAIAAVRSGSTPTSESSSNLVATMLYGDLGVASVITATTADDSVIVDVWFFHVVGVEPDLTIDSVTRGIRCRDGSLHPPDFACL